MFSLILRLFTLLHGIFQSVTLFHLTGSYPWGEATKRGHRKKSEFPSHSLDSFSWFLWPERRFSLGILHGCTTNIRLCLCRSLSDCDCLQGRVVGGERKIMANSPLLAPTHSLSQSSPFPWSSGQKNVVC